MDVSAIFVRLMMMLMVTQERTGQDCLSSVTRSTAALVVSVTVLVVNERWSTAVNIYKDSLIINFS